MLVALWFVTFVWSSCQKPNRVAFFELGVHPADFDITKGGTIMFGAACNIEMLSCVHIIGHCSCSMLSQVKLNSFE